MEKFSVTELLSGEEVDASNEKERECYDTLNNLGIKFQIVKYNFFPSDIESLNLIDEKIQVKGIKNLIFRTKNKEQYFFIIIPRDDRFDEKLFRSKYNLPKISMATSDELKDLLKTHSGAVSIMELANDEKGIIKLYIAKSVLENNFFRFHPNKNSATVRISMLDFKEKLTSYLRHDINIL